MIKAFSKQGLPLKITAEYTKDVYHYYDFQDELCSDPVEGWLVRINGYKFPRPQMMDGELDYTMRYVSPKNNEEGKIIAIKKAMREYEKN